MFQSSASCDAVQSKLCYYQPYMSLYASMYHGEKKHFLAIPSSSTIIKGLNLKTVLLSFARGQANNEWLPGVEWQNVQVVYLWQKDVGGSTGMQKLRSKFGQCHNC